MTVLHSGPVDEFHDGEIDQIIERMSAACATIPRFELTLDRPHIGRVAVECSGRPGMPTRRLWQLAADVTDAVTGARFARTPQVYYPHISLAYATGQVDGRPLKEWLSDCDMGPVKIPVSMVSLVAQSHDTRRITWRRVAEVPLAT